MWDNRRKRRPSAAFFSTICRHIHIVLIAGLPCSFIVPPVSANPYLVLDSFSHSESVPITDAIGDWENPIKDGDKAFTYNWAEIGATYKAFGLGFLSRYDYELQYSPGTAEFYHLVNNKKSLPLNKQYNLDLAAKHTYSEGVRLSYCFQFKKQLEITIGGSYLKGLRLTDGRLRGTATAIAENDYDFNANVDYYYSEDVLFDRKVDKPDGVGFSIDSLINWRIRQKLNMRLAITDLIGRMYWSNAPNTTATATSATKDYDEDGYVKYNPALSGYETNRDFTQKLYPRVNLKFNYSLDSKTDLVGQIYNFHPGSFYQVGGEYAFNANNRGQILYMFDTNAISLGYMGKYFQFDIMSDSFNIDKAYLFAFKLNVHIHFI
jgi:hypothetical protein